VFHLDGPDLEGRLGRLDVLHSAYHRFVSDITGDAAIRACLDEHLLSWTRLLCIELRFDTDEAAREAVLCLREDGMGAADVARLAGAGMSEVSLLLEEVDSSLSSVLIGAHPGDVLGPLADGASAHRILVVTNRKPPSVDDPAVCHRARALIVAAAVERLTAGEVRWHGAL
jgi:hypothetical protein